MPYAKGLDCAIDCWSRTAETACLVCTWVLALNILSCSLCMNGKKTKIVRDFTAVVRGPFQNRCLNTLTSVQSAAELHIRGIHTYRYPPMMPYSVGMICTWALVRLVSTF